MTHLARLLGAAYLATLGLAAQSAHAQFNDQWVQFRPDPERLVTPVPLTNTDTQAHFSWGDLDHDGWTDLVVMRAQQFTSSGKRPNFLLRNEDGVLVDRSAEYASQSLGTPVDDFGFLTPTNDRSSVVVDVNGDGWLDVVTAVTVSDADPKHIGHPRVYINLGENTDGEWLGLRFENARFPQLFQFTTGLPRNPRFSDVSAGDINADGHADLYFVDHDSSGAGGAGEPPGHDMNDRLLFNEGSGFFADVSQVSMTSQMLLSAYGIACRVADMNGDDYPDVVKVSASGVPQTVSLAYNRPDLPGVFSQFQAPVLQSPYYVDVGDLNNDGRLDVVVATDFGDKFSLNTGTDALGRVIWGPAESVQTLVGEEFKWGGGTRIADLDLDGWNDVIVTDVDVDIGSYSGRTNIYQNLGGKVGGNIVLLEQREKPDNSGWVGAVGIKVDDLRGTHDVAVIDIDNDGDLDLLISRRLGNLVWLNLTDPVVCQTDLGFGGPGSSTLSLCGQPLWAGNESTLSVQGAPPGAPAGFVVGVGQGALPILGGIIVPDPAIVLPDLFTANGAGQISVPIVGIGNPATVVVQAVVLDPGQPAGFQITNALSVQFQ
ncbi:MAG: hypothetical protein GC161_17450 [Planctomycetaceae bacterium]|nr:hypothetical protein [Planctomycetaceae bacterium]